METGIVSYEEWAKRARLRHGKHNSCADGMCGMEAVVDYRRHVLGDTDAPWTDADENHPVPRVRA